MKLVPFSDVLPRHFFALSPDVGEGPILTRLARPRRNGRGAWWNALSDSGIRYQVKDGCPCYVADDQPTTPSPA